MPRPPSPPPTDEAGAISNPRQLNRWLDNNPVFPLERTQTYFKLPDFSVIADWKGYSEIVAVFDYQATNNFSLKAFEAPAGVNYCPCIMWVDADYNVFRYPLWRDVGEVFFFEVPTYAGQLIKKNFRIEIWNCAPSEVLTVTLAGAGTGNVNGTYSFTSSIAWNQLTPAPLNVISHAIGAAYWEVTLGTVKYKVLATTFPFGLYELVFGVAPPPYAYMPNQESSQADEFTLYTSKRGNYDYMWQDDNSLALASAIVTNFSVALPSVLPVVWPADSVPTINS